MTPTELLSREQKQDYNEGLTRRVSVGEADIAGSIAATISLPGGGSLFMVLPQETTHQYKLAGLEANDVQHGIAKYPRGQDEARFKVLAEQWRRDTAGVSSSTVTILSPPYQKIISMGKQVLPFIFKDLKENYGHWFWALTILTGENPVPPEDEGNIQKMREMWLEYGERNNIIA